MYSLKQLEKDCNFESERCIGDNYTIELRARFLSGADFGEAYFPGAHDDYIQIHLARYF